MLTFVIEKYPQMHTAVNAHNRAMVRDTQPGATRSRCAATAAAAAQRGARHCLARINTRLYH